MAYLLEWQLFAFNIVKALAMINIFWKGVQPFSFIKEFRNPSPFVHSSYCIEYDISETLFCEIIKTVLWFLNGRYF